MYLSGITYGNSERNLKDFKFMGGALFKANEFGVVYPMMGYINSDMDS